MSTSLDPTSALIGLGGNVGDVVSAMQTALDTLKAHDSCDVVTVSDVFRTPPWGITDQDWFFNACAEVVTTLGAEQLLDVMLDIELRAGRVREKRWGPRTLDLDIIAFGDEAISTERLTVPHPRMGERAFVIVPLMDIAPDRMIGVKRAKDYLVGLELGEIERFNKELVINVTS